MKKKSEQVTSKKTWWSWWIFTCTYFRLKLLFTICLLPLGYFTQWSKDSQHWKFEYQISCISEHTQFLHLEFAELEQCSTKGRFLIFAEVFKERKLLKITWYFEILVKDGGRKWKFGYFIYKKVSGKMLDCVTYIINQFRSEMAFSMNTCRLSNICPEICTIHLLALKILPT